MAKFQIGDRVQACALSGLSLGGLRNGDKGTVAVEGDEDGIYWVRWDNHRLNVCRDGRAAARMFLASEHAGWIERNRFAIGTHAPIIAGIALVIVFAARAVLS